MLRAASTHWRAIVLAVAASAALVIPFRANADGASTAPVLTADEISAFQANQTAAVATLGASGFGYAVDLPSGLGTGGVAADLSSAVSQATAALSATAADSGATLTAADQATISAVLGAEYTARTTPSSLVAGPISSAAPSTSPAPATTPTGTAGPVVGVPTDLTTLEANQAAAVSTFGSAGFGYEVQLPDGIVSGGIAPDLSTAISQASGALKTVETDAGLSLSAADTTTITNALTVEYQNRASITSATP